MTEDGKLQPINPNFKFNSTFKPDSSHHFRWEGRGQTDLAQRILAIPTWSKSAWPDFPPSPPDSTARPSPIPWNQRFLQHNCDCWSKFQAGFIQGEGLLRCGGTWSGAAPAGALRDRACLAQHMFLCISYTRELTKSGSFRRNNQESWRFVLRIWLWNSFSH